MDEYGLLKMLVAIVARQQDTLVRLATTHFPSKQCHIGYIDLKTGGYAVDMKSRKKPVPGDRVNIRIVRRDGTVDSTEELITEVLHEEPNWSPRNPSRYLVAIQSQDQVNKLMSEMDNPETRWDYQ